MEDRLVTLERVERTAIIIMNNPPVNVINEKLRVQLKQCLMEAANDDGVSAIIITGVGQKAFMAGADIKDFPAMVKTPRAAYEFVYHAYEVLFFLEQIGKPTIAAINGMALGAGLELALCCDIRISAESANVGLPEIKLGLFPGGGGTQRLSRLIGKSKAKELIFTGESITADRALELGIVNHVVPEGTVLERAMELADVMGKYSAAALSAAKEAIDCGENLSLRDGIEYEAQMFQCVFMGDEVGEGIDAFLEKRLPNFHKKSNSIRRK